jgi:hypothetical protein
MSQPTNKAKPSKPQNHGVRKRENENFVDCSEFRTRQKMPFSYVRLIGVIDTGCNARS